MPQVAVAREVSAVSVDSELPSDPNLRAILEDVLAKLKYSFAVAAAGNQPPAPGQADRIFQAFLSSRKPKSRAGYQQHAQALLQAPMAIRSQHFGRFAAIDPTTVAKIGSDQLDAHVDKPKMDAAVLKKSLEEHGKELEKHASPSAQKMAEALKKLEHENDQVAGSAFTTMRLSITRVKAIQDTDDRGGGDDIAMGGLYVGAKGHTTQVKEFEVSDDSFSSGDVVKTNRVFAKWNLETRPAGFPYVYTAVIALAETDDGGFDEFLEKLWGHVKSRVEEAVGGKPLEDIAQAIGSIWGTIGSMIGKAIAVFFEWFISIFQSPDDIIGVKTVRITLSKSTMSYYVARDLTEPAGNVRTLDYKGQGGHYLIDVAFRVAQA